MKTMVLMLCLFLFQSVQAFQFNAEFRSMYAHAVTFVEKKGYMVLDGAMKIKPITKKKSPEMILNAGRQTEKIKWEGGNIRIKQTQRTEQRTLVMEVLKYQDNRFYEIEISYPDYRIISEKPKYEYDE